MAKRSDDILKTGCARDQVVACWVVVSCVLVVPFYAKPRLNGIFVVALHVVDSDGGAAHCRSCRASGQTRLG